MKYLIKYTECYDGREYHGIDMIHCHPEDLTESLDFYVRNVRGDQPEDVSIDEYGHYHLEDGLTVISNIKSYKLTDDEVRIFEKFNL